MKPRRQRMIFVAVMLLGVALAGVLVLQAIGENMLYFYSPTQIKSGEAPTNHTVRVGGLVVEGSIRRETQGVTVHFELTDTAERITIAYTGILPDLFREGQGIVARGRIGEDGVFMAEEVLAKHDENYMPPDVAEALETARSGGKVKAAP